MASKNTTPPKGKRSARRKPAVGPGRSHALSAFPEKPAALYLDGPTASYMASAADPANPNIHPRLSNSPLPSRAFHVRRFVTITMNPSHQAMIVWRPMNAVLNSQASGLLNPTVAPVDWWCDVHATSDSWGGPGVTPTLYFNGPTDPAKILEPYGNTQSTYDASQFTFSEPAHATDIRNRGLCRLVTARMYLTHQIPSATTTVATVERVGNGNMFENADPSGTTINVWELEYNSPSEMASDALGTWSVYEEGEFPYVDYRPQLQADLAWQQIVTNESDGSPLGWGQATYSRNTGVAPTVTPACANIWMNQGIVDSSANNTVKAIYVKVTPTYPVAGPITLTLMIHANFELSGPAFQRAAGTTLSLVTSLNPYPELPIAMHRDRDKVGRALAEEVDVAPREFTQTQGEPTRPFRAGAAKHVDGELETMAHTAAKALQEVPKVDGLPAAAGIKIKPKHPILAAAKRVAPSLLGMIPGVGGALAGVAKSLLGD